MSLFRIISLAKAQATQAEIEAVVGYPCNGDDEQAAIERGRLQGVAELREKQYERAMKGDTAAMSQLTKHLLGQTGEGVQVNINLGDVLKRIDSLRRGAIPVVSSPIVITPRSDDVMVDPPGENEAAVGAAFETHPEKNSKNEN